MPSLLCFLWYFVGVCYEVGITAATPVEAICCDTYNRLSCALNVECFWNGNECSYMEEPVDFMKEICTQQTDIESCAFTVDDDLSAVPVFEVREELVEHSTNNFPSSQPEIMRVTDGIYVALGYDLANTIIIETESGIIIIDTLGERDAAESAFTDYKTLRITDDRQRTDLQMEVEAIILTHYHPDHSFGIGFWLDLNEENGFTQSIPTVYVNSNFLEQSKRLLLYSAIPITKRSKRQFGALLKWEFDQEWKDEKNIFFNSGIGPHLNPEDAATFVNPISDDLVQIVDEEYKITISNVALTLIHAPGETSDQMAIWYEQKQALFCGDNIYYAFPNLYSIRGTTPRDPKKWMNSLDVYLDHNIEFLIGSHTLPISGWSNVEQEISLYRDLIAFVHDQTVRYMSKHWLVNEIVDVIETTLPPQLRTGRKQEFYGTIEWSVRSIYDMYLGWFKGDASELYPSNRYDRGQGLNALLSHVSSGNAMVSMIDSLVEYLNKILDEAVAEKSDTNYVQVALKEERWILETVTSLAAYYGSFKQCDEWLKLMELRWKIIENIAGRCVSANGRNYLITMYLEERFNLAIPTDINRESDIFQAMPVKWLLEALRSKVRPELILSFENEWRTNMKFIDSGLMFQLHLRHGGVLKITEYGSFDSVVIDEYDNKAQVIYSLTEQDFKDGKLLDESLLIKGDTVSVLNFWARFDVYSAENIAGNGIGTIEKLYNIWLLFARSE